jgi:hypothetical protein
MCHEVTAISPIDRGLAYKSGSSNNRHLPSLTKSVRVHEKVGDMQAVSSPPSCNWVPDHLVGEKSTASKKTDNPTS